MKLREAIFRVADTSGAMALIRDSEWRRRRLMILCYHGVSAHDEHEWSPTLYVTQDHLRQRLRSLRDGGYTILSLAEGTERLYAGTLPKRAVAITFDDGAMDFERRALPVLREFDAPATLYLTTYYCVNRFPVFNTVLSYVMWKGRNSGADLSTVIGGDTPLLIGDADVRLATDVRIREYADEQGLTAEQKDALMGRIAAAIGVDYEAIRARGTLQLMTPETVSTLPMDLIDVQLHTHRHRTPRDHALFVREIHDNEDVIRKLRGADRTLDHFCYPSGEYYGQFFEWLRECNVKYATTCVPNIATPKSEPMLLPRLVDTMLHTPLSFDAALTGFASLLPKRRKYRLDPERLAG
jgi:peptidoglycan/xylan/chitin deacetylase (PgdA/CDA1 family)